LERTSPSAFDVHCHVNGTPAFAPAMLWKAFLLVIRKGS
jgi:hypothetical protein